MQAKSAGMALASIKFDKIYHSGLLRTMETADLVLNENAHANSTNSDHKSVAGLEELRGGVFHTDSREELAARLAFSFEVADQNGAEFLPGGEVFHEAYERITASFQKLVLKDNWQTALLVAHEGVNRILMSYLCKAGLSAVGVFEQDLCCINVLDIDVVPDKSGAKIERTIIKAINLTSYDHVKERLNKTSLEHMFGIDFGGNRPRFD